jgi:hypothetical protein
MDTQLNDQVTAMFRAAGFTGVTTVRGDTFLTVSGVQGTTRAVFHANANATAAPTGGAGRGGRYTDTPELVAAVVPSYPDMRQALLDNPEMVKAMGLSAERLEIVRKMPVSA